MALSKILGFMDEGSSFRVHPSTLKGLETVEGGAEAIARMRKEFQLTTLQNGELFAEAKVTENMIEQTKANIGGLTDHETSMNDHAYKAVNGEVPAGESPIAHDFNTSAVIGGVTLPARMLKNYRKLSDTADVINAKLMPREFDLLPKLNWDGKKIGGTMLQIFSNPKHAFRELSTDLVTLPTELKVMGDKYGKHSRAVWKNLTKGFGDEQFGTLNHVLAESNDAEEVFKVHARGLVNSKGQVFKVTAEVQEAYFGTRMLMDHLYWLNNTAAVRQGRQNGFKVLDHVAGDQMVRQVKGRHGEALTALKEAGETPTYMKWSKKLDDEGYKVIELQGNKGKVARVVLSPDEANRMLKDIPDGHAMIPYRKGYVPVIYKDQWAINRVVKMKDGSFRSSRVATAPTIVRANKGVSQFTKEQKLAEDELEATFIASRKNDASTDVAYGENLHNILDNLSNTELEGMKKALRDLGMEKEAVESLERTGRFFSHKRNAFMMGRGPRLKDWRGVEKADILPADEAIQKYMQSSSSYSANAEYMSNLQNKYLDEFGELLTDSNDFLSPVKDKIMGTASNGRTSLEARQVRGQIERLMGVNSDLDRVIENHIVSTLDKFGKTRVGKSMDVMFDKLSDVWGIGGLIGTPSLVHGTAKIKGFTAMAKLGLWNMSQAVVQGTAALNVLGKNPIHAARASKDMVQAIGPEIMRIGRTAKGRALYEQIDNAGFIAGFDYVELQRVAAKGTDKLLGSRSLRKVMNTNLLPYQLGEGGVRALAWFTERRILIDMIESGKSPFTKADIDGELFRQSVTEAASITALNMSRVNQPLISRGLLGVPFQFKQFLIQQSEFLLRTSNFRNKREMVGTWSAWIGAFGVAGVPWMFDAGIAADGVMVAGSEALEAMGIDSSSPAYVGKSRKMAKEMVHDFSKLAADFSDTNYKDTVAFWDRWATSGLLSAMTEGELNLASRASLARVLTEYHGNSSLDDNLFGPGYQTAKMLIKNDIGTIADMVNMWRNGDEFTPGYLIEAAGEAARGLPGIQHPIQAAEMMLTGETRDTERRLINDEPTLSEIIYIGVGLGDGRRSERFERIEFTKKTAKAWKDWSRTRQQKIAKLSQQGHIKYADVLYEDTLRQISEVNPTLISEFLMGYSNEMLRRNMTGDEREFMENHEDLYFYGSTYDKFFFGRDIYIGRGDE